MSFTVRKALQMDHMKDAELIGGSGGLDRIISCVDISETPDLYEWLRPNEFLITTGYSIRDNLESQMKLLRSLSQTQGAVLAVKFGRFIGSIPQELVDLSDEFDIPLISFPDNPPFIDITYPLMQRIVNNQARQLEYSEKIYKMLTKVALETNNLESISSALDPILDGIKVIQRRVLDGMTREALKNIEPKEQDYILVTRLSEGSSVQIAEKYILPRIQEHINYLINYEEVTGGGDLCFVQGSFLHLIVLFRCYIHKYFCNILPWLF